MDEYQRSPKLARSALEMRLGRIDKKWSSKETSFVLGPLDLGGDVGLETSLATYLPHYLGYLHNYKRHYGREISTLLFSCLPPSVFFFF